MKCTQWHFEGHGSAHLRKTVFEHPIIQLVRKFLAFCEPHIFIKGMYMVAQFVETPSW
jgi:hypothetical protein